MLAQKFACAETKTMSKPDAVVHCAYSVYMCVNWSITLFMVKKKGYCTLEFFICRSRLFLRARIK